MWKLSGKCYTNWLGSPQSSSRSSGDLLGLKPKVSTVVTSADSYVPVGIFQISKLNFLDNFWLSDPMDYEIVFWLIFEYAKRKNLQKCQSYRSINKTYDFMHHKTIFAYLENVKHKAYGQWKILNRMNKSDSKYCHIWNKVLNRILYFCQFFVAYVHQNQSEKRR